MAGTDANVYLTLFGTEGDSAEQQLDTSTKRLEPGTAVAFRLQMPDVGDLERIRIGHDNQGVSAGWFLHRVVIRNERTGKEWIFSCDRWLAVDEDDGEIERILHPRQVLI